MTEIFSAAQIEELSAEIDRQLQELRRSGAATYKSGDELEPDGALSKQKESIEQLTQEPMSIFMAKIGRAAKSEICDEDGFLYKQWEKWGELDNKDTLKIFGGILAGMGITGHILPTLTVAVVVVIGRIGRRAFCEDYGNNT
jgi:hypothetical protein